MKYKVGEKVKTSMTDREGVVIATDGRNDAHAKVKVKFNGILAGSSWEYETMLDRVIE